MNELPIICFDFETAGPRAIAVNPHLCYPIQVAAMAIDPRKLEPIPGGTFSSMICPADVNDSQWETAEQDWKEALDINKKKVEDIKTAPAEAEVWKAFAAFVNKYNPKGNQYNAPIAAGQNIDRFDLIIADRLNAKHKISKKEDQYLLFNNRISLDLKNILFVWFEGNNDLKNHKMDTLRQYLGMSAEGAHDAMQDVKDTTDVIVRFLKLHRKLFKHITFKGAFAHEKYG